MIMKEEIKLRMIWKIDTLSIDAKFQRRELNSLRKKYIFKDISYCEFINDIKWLNNLSNLNKKIKNVESVRF